MVENELANHKHLLNGSFAGLTEAMPLVAFIIPQPVHFTRAADRCSQVFSRMFRFSLAPTVAGWHDLANS
jgi:hypothetical protein